MGQPIQRDTTLGHSLSTSFSCLRRRMSEPCGLLRCRPARGLAGGRRAARAEEPDVRAAPTMPTQTRGASPPRGRRVRHGSGTLAGSALAAWRRRRTRKARSRRSRQSSARRLSRRLCQHCTCLRTGCARNLRLQTSQSRGWSRPHCSGDQRLILLLLLPGFLQHRHARTQCMRQNVSDCENCISVAASCNLRRSSTLRPWRLLKFQSHPLDRS